MFVIFTVFRMWLLIATFSCYELKVQITADEYRHLLSVFFVLANVNTVLRVINS